MVHLEATKKVAMRRNEGIIRLGTYKKVAYEGVNRLGIYKKVPI